MLLANGQSFIVNVVGSTIPSKSFAVLGPNVSTLPYCIRLECSQTRLCAGHLQSLFIVLWLHSVYGENGAIAATNFNVKHVHISNFSLPPV